MHATFQDLRFALRTLFFRHLSLTLVCTATLGLGVGANTAIFSVVRGVLLDPLPYPEPERLVRLYNGWDEAPDARQFLPGPDVVDLRDATDLFEGVACAYTYNEVGFDLTGGGRPERVASLRVSAGYFELFGARPLFGRTFERTEETDDDAVVVLAHHLWQHHFAADPAILGEAIQLNGTPFTVIGVMPPGFQAPLGRRADVWVPQNLQAGGYNSRGNHYLSAVARLRSGVSLEEAKAGLQVLSERIRQENPETHRGQFVYLLSLHEDLVGKTRPMLYALLGAVGLVLLIACVNVANLLLVRGAARRKEFAVRAALGSGRARLVRQLLTENLLLAALGGLAGAGLAWAGVRLLLVLRPADLPRLETIGIDYRLFLVSAGLTLVTGLVFGLVPALQGGRLRLEEALREGGRGQAGSAWLRRSRQVLVVFQVALALVLLTGAGLLMRSFVKLTEVDLGFEPESALSFRVNLPGARYGTGEERHRFYERFLESQGNLPGVLAAGAVSKLPLAGRYHQWGYGIEALDPDADPDRQSADMRVVAGRYFAAMGIPLLEGRLLDARDHAEATLNVVVNNAMVARHLPERDAIGTRLWVAGDTRTIVGVVGSTRHEHHEEAVAQIYIPHSQFADDRNWSLTQVVKTAVPGLAVLDGARRELAALDPKLIIHSVRPLETVVSNNVAAQSFALLLMSLFALVALILAAVGLYGVLAFVVQERTREIGIRVALGAGRGHVRALVAGQCLGLTVFGLVAGLGGALYVTRWLESLIFEIGVTDPATFAGVAVVLALVAALAGLVPVRRATRVDPLEVLRYE